MKVSGFVTAGGRSSRMGRDKAWLPVAGRPMIEVILGALAPVCDEIAVIASGDEYARLGYRVIEDVNKGLGPIEAVRIALASSRNEHAILVGCDLPFVTSELLSFLTSMIEGNLAVVPTDSAGRLEPLCAVYSKSALGAVEEMIREGDFKIRSLFDRGTTRVVRFEEIEPLSGSSLFFENVNTPGEYDRALRLAAERQQIRNKIELR